MAKMFFSIFFSRKKEEYSKKKNSFPSYIRHKIVL